MTPPPLVVSRHHEVLALLADPRLTVISAPRPPFTLTVAWLRGAVGRFTDGPAHAERRAEAVRILAGLDTRTLREEAFRQASARPQEAEHLATEVLAVALGVRAEDGRQAARAVTAIAAAYLPAAAPPTSGGPDTRATPSPWARQDTVAADDGLVRLSRLLGDPQPQRLAVLAGLLAQACDATAGLIRNALAAGAVAGPVEDLLAETLRHDPPVRTLRRTVTGPGVNGAAQGTVVLLDVAAANRDPEVFDDPGRFRPGRPGEHLTFGAGPRSCPAQEVALALAAGVVQAVRR